MVVRVTDISLSSSKFVSDRQGILNGDVPTLPDLTLAVQQNDIFEARVQASYHRNHELPSYQVATSLRLPPRADMVATLTTTRSVRLLSLGALLFSLLYLRREKWIF